MVVILESQFTDKLETFNSIKIKLTILTTNII